MPDGRDAEADLAVRPLLPGLHACFPAARFVRMSARMPPPGHDKASCPTYVAEITSLTLDLVTMYRECIAPDLGSLPRKYGGSCAGNGVFCVRAGAGKAYWPEDGGNSYGRYLLLLLLLMLFVAQDRLSARQFIAD
jgi:hypothetical protein